MNADLPFSLQLVLFMISSECRRIKKFDTRLSDEIYTTKKIKVRIIKHESLHGISHSNIK